MANFFNFFPKVPYDINKAEYTTYQQPTNILVRIGIIKETLENISSYYLYDIREGETPEILADIVYGTPEAHWIIMMANDIQNGAYDWPLGYDEFNKYIANKYRDTAGGNTLTDIQVISWSQKTNDVTANNIYKYEKVIERTDVETNTKTVWRYQVDYDKETTTEPTGVPYEYYVNLPVSSSNTYNINGKSIVETVSRSFQTVYDYEIEQNEMKRSIKIIKPEYYFQITSELKNLLNVKSKMKRNLR